MKQVFLLSLFVTALHATSAQNISPANPIAASISTIKNFNEKFKGTWVSYYANGNRCDSGRLVNNIPDGLWKSWYANGQLRVQMYCNARRLVSAKDDMERVSDKLMYRQLYQSIHPHEMEGNAEAVQVNVQSGKKINSFQTGEPPFTECMVHGVYKSWLENGMLKDSGYCENGIRKGVWEEWDENTHLKGVGFYKNGLRFKDWRYYNKEGKLESIKWFNRQEEVTETIVLK